QRSRQRAGRAAWLALPCLGVASLFLVLGTASLPASFAGLFAFALAATMLTPIATATLMRTLHRLLPNRSVMARLAARGVTAGLSRTGVAVSALMLAVATVVGVGLMIASFRGSVIHWLENVVQADFYMAATDREAAVPQVTDALLAELAALPGVERTGAIRNAWLPTATGQHRLWAIQPSRDGGDDALGLMLKRPERLSAPLSNGAVLVSEPYSAKHGVDVGDVLVLPTPTGERRYPIAGVFIDYSSDRGVIAMHRDSYRRDFGDARLDAVRIHVDPAATAAVRDALDARVAGSNGALRMTSSGDIRALSLEVFDRTFTITEVLRVLAGLVAFLGVLSALQALALERAREFATLRAIGFSPRQVLTLIIGQTGLLGLAAGLFAIPTGIALAMLLVFVINQRAFGWSMELTLSGAVLAQGVVLALIAAILAGLYPAWRSAGAVPARGLREE
ncbi:MAG: ABC transporter permease, partial [Pseudomonadota bacterium]